MSIAKGNNKSAPKIMNDDTNYMFAKGFLTTDKYGYR